MLTLATWKSDNTDSQTVKTMNSQFHRVFSKFCHIFVLILVLIVTLDYMEINLTVLNRFLSPSTKFL